MTDDAKSRRRGLVEIYVADHKRGIAAKVLLTKVNDEATLDFSRALARWGANGCFRTLSGPVK
jgi:hypothetical protein